MADDAHTLMFLLSPKKPVGLDLRLAGHLAEVVQSEHFEQRWLDAKTDKDMNEVLMRDDHFLHGPVSSFPALAVQTGKPISEVDVAGSCIIALIERGGDVMAATPDTLLLEGDEVAIIGEPDDLTALKREITTA